MNQSKLIIETVPEGKLIQIDVKMKVSERALLQRINRVLDKDGRGHVIKKSRRQNGVSLSSGGRDVMGYYELWTREKAVPRDDIDLEHEGRRLGVLKPWEAL